MRSGRSLQCGCCDSRGSVSGLDTAFTKVLSHAVVDHTIIGTYLVAVFWQDMYHSGRDSDPMEVSYITTVWLAYRGARGLHCLSACDLEASK